MGILFFIIKIILFILLGILALIVLALSVILFIPIRYKLDGYELSIGWLLGLIRFRGSYSSEEGIKAKLKILKFTLFNSEKETSDDSVSKSEDKKTDKQKKADKRKKKDKQKKTEEVSKDNIKSLELNGDTSENSKEHSPEKKTEEKDKSKGKKKRHRNDKKKESSVNKIKKILYLIRDNKYALKCLLEQLIYILKKMSPKKVSVNVNFGFSDPAITGWLLGALAMIPWVYKKGVKINPDFTCDGAYINGSWFLAGSLRLWTILVVVIRLIRIKEIRTIIKGVL